MINRMVRAFRNDLTLYPELKESEDASSQGYLVIVIIAAVAAVGGTITAPLIDNFLANIAISIVSTLAVYVLVLVIAYVIAKVGSGEGTFHQLRASLAYGYTPSILGFTPLIGFLFSLWSLVTISSAIRETMGIGKWLTFFIVIVALAANFFIFVVIFTAIMGLFFLPAF